MTPLIGRDQELATVRAAVRTGQPRTVLITGPSGVGRRRLLREAIAGTPAARAVASPVAPVPFGLVSDLVTVEPAADRAHTIRRYVAALRDLDRVVAVEDLHWADADSLAVLVDFARTPSGPGLLATARDEPHHPLVEAMGSLASTPDVTVVTLAGLGTGGVAALIEAVWQAPVPISTAVRVRRRTGGLPYWVEELARAAGTAEALAQAALPGMAAAGLRARVEAAGPDAVRCAEVAAVLGERVDLNLLAQVLAQPVAAVLPALRRLVAAWVVEEVAPDRFAFRHPLTREALAAPVPEADQRTWHARAHQVLREAGADDPVLAWHAAGAGLPAATVECATRAATALLSAGSAAEALRMAELALESGAQPAWPAHALAAQAAYSAGWFDEAQAHTEAWLAATSGAPAAEAYCLLASLRWRAGDLAGQWAALRAARTGLAEAETEAGGASAAQARVYASLASGLLRAERDAEAIVEADRALAAAQRAGAAAVWRDALVTKGTALCHQAFVNLDPAGRAAGLGLLAEAEQASEQAGDRLALGRAVNNALDYRMAGRPPAQQWTVWQDAWQRAHRLDLSPSLGKITRQAIDLAYQTGQWERGWRPVTARLPEETDPVDRVVLAARAALLALEAGRIDEAIPLAERSTAEVAGMDQIWAVLYVALVDVALTARTAPAASTLRALGRYRAAVRPADHARRPHRAAEAAIAALDAGVAPDPVRAFLATTVPGGLPEWIADDLALALAEAAGDDRPAVLAGERALRRHDKAQRPNAVRRADTLTRLGRSLLRTGAVARAAELAAEACTLLAGWPGDRLAAAQALRDAAAAGGPALTRREREVRMKVAEGLSNAEIGEQLGISPRTVAVHVSRLLAKTGASSRTELAVGYLSGAS